MKNAKNLFGYDSLAFFGRVNASISHELKNIMAIISETAGLLSDLSEMASTGTPVDPGLLKNSTDSIMEEIQRGFETIRQMNRFSHSVDKPVISTDLIELLNLVCHLCNYLSFSGMLRVTQWVGDPPVVQTCPFQLQAIVYEIIVQHFKNAGPDGQLEVTVQPLHDSGCRIVFSNVFLKDVQVFPDDHLRNAAASIAVIIECDRDENQLELYVPSAIQLVAENDVAIQAIPADGRPSF
jgi:signal transduction histidine kinase